MVARWCAIITPSCSVIQGPSSHNVNPNATTRGRNPSAGSLICVAAWKMLTARPITSATISTGADTFDFVSGFEQRDIPVGVVVLDSPWETNYNTFIPNDSRYPNFEDMVANLHGRNVRTVLWITQMLNDASLDVEVGGDTYPGPADGFNEAKRRGLFVNEGKTHFWWKGTGGGIDLPIR